MIVLGLLIERVVLRPLVNQPQITLFMATIGLSFFIEGLAQMLWGANVRGLELGMQDEPIKWLTDATGMNVSKFDLVAAGIAAVLVAALGALLQPHADRPRAARRRRRSPGGARRRHSAAADLGHRLGAWPGSSRWSPACCGARATACSSR